MDTLSKQRQGSKFGKIRTIKFEAFPCVINGNLAKCNVLGSIQAKAHKTRRRTIIDERQGDREATTRLRSRARRQFFEQFFLFGTTHYT